MLKLVENVETEFLIKILRFCENTYIFVKWKRRWKFVEYVEYVEYLEYLEILENLEYLEYLENLEFYHENLEFYHQNLVDFI